MSICKYCNKNEAIKNSHILPRFIFDWLKKTSGTGGMRYTLTPNKRVQDGIKVDMLCPECEKQFSQYETSFKLNVFSKIANYRQQHDIIELKKLDKQCIYSMVWRVLSWSYHYEKLDQFYSHELALIPKYLEILKLATKTGHSPELKTYIVPLTERIIYNANLPSVNFMYYDRSIGMEPRIYDDMLRLFIYIKLPFILIVCELISCDIDIWKAPQIENVSKINTLENYEIPNYVHEQIKHCYEEYLKSAKNISPEQERLIIRSLQNVSKESGTFKTLKKNEPKA